MKKLLTRAVLVFIFISGLVVSVSAAPVVTIESTSIVAGTTSFDLDVNFNTDASSPIDSATFTLLLPTGVTFTSTTFGTLPANWVPTSVPATKQFGATDFGFPANQITSSQLFATLFFGLDPAFSIAGNSFPIGFSFAEMTNAAGAIYANSLNPGLVTVNAVPIPAAVWLLGSGVVGLLALRRRRNA